MAFVPGHAHDVFISYSHANDFDGWVSSFRSLLFGLLKERAHDVSFYRDQESLQGNEELTPAIRAAVRESAVFVAIVSRSYLTRPWCVKECREFMEANAGSLNRRLFVVRYDDVDFSEFQKLTGERTGYKFFDETTGDPLDPESPELKAAMSTLRKHIAARLQELRVEATAPAASEARPQSPCLFLAEPAPGLGEAADRLTSFLEGFGYAVIRPGERFYDEDGFESAFAAGLRKSLLFVQLLGRKFDPHPDDHVHSWDRWQFLQAEAAGVPAFRWFNRHDKDGNEIDLQKLDADHRELVTASGVWNCEASRFRELIRGELERRYHDLRQQERVAAGDSVQPLVVLRADRSDRAFAESIGQTLRQMQIDWLRPPEKDFASLEEFAREYAANGLIVVYRACPGKWVLTRLQELRKFLKSDFGRRWVCGLWRAPEDDEDALSCSVEGLFVIDPQTPDLLSQFIAQLRTRLTEEEAAP